MMYSEKSIKAFLSFENTGIIKGSDATSKIINKECGDIYKIYTKIDKKKVVEAKYQAFGSVLIFASLNACIKLILNKNAEEIRSITVSDILKEMGECPKSKIYVLHYAVDTLKKLADEIDEFTGDLKVIKKAPVKTKKEQQKPEEKVEAKKEEVVIKEEKPQEQQDPVKNTKKATTKIITITQNGEGETPIVKVENHAKMTADDIKEIIDNKIQESKAQDDTEVKVIEAVKKEEPVSNEQTNAKSKKKHVKHDSLFKDEDDNDMENEIDSITAKITDALSNLNFKFDDIDQE